MKRNTIIKVINCIDEISLKMNEIIYKRYFDNVHKDSKYLLGIFDDAFKTADVICYSIKRIALTQAGDLIRKFIEQTAIVTLLTNNPDKLPKYIEHYIFRKEIVNLDRKEQAKQIVEKFHIHDKKINPLSYLDYGWIEDNCKESMMLEKAGFKDLVTWKHTYLDKFVHSSFSNLDLLGDGYNFPILKPLVIMTSKIFDYLCCAFHKLTGFDFVINKEDLFQDRFRNLYAKLQF